jgi:Alcohol dehydrogenase GroES-like domain
MLLYTNLAEDMYCCTLKRPEYAGIFHLKPTFKVHWLNNCNRSDIHFWKAGRIGELIFKGDGIIGHEAAGIVLKVGEDVDNVQPVFIHNP